MDEEIAKMQLNEYVDQTRGSVAGDLAILLVSMDAPNGQCCVAVATSHSEKFEMQHFKEGSHNSELLTLFSRGVATVIASSFLTSDDPEKQYGKIRSLVMGVFEEAIDDAISQVAGFKDDASA